MSPTPAIRQWTVFEIEIIWNRTQGGCASRAPRAAGRRPYHPYGAENNPWQKAYVPDMFSHPAPLRGPDHDGDLDGAGAVPAERRKTCLPLLGALATGAPALWPACVQLNDARIHLGPSGGPAQWQATAWEALFSRLIADRKIGSCV